MLVFLEEMTQLVCWIARQPWCQHRVCFPALGAFECPHTEHQLVSKWALTAVTDHRGCQCVKAADKALLNSTAVLSKIIALPVKTKQKPSQQWNKSPVLLCRFTAGAWQGRGGGHPCWLVLLQGGSSAALAPNGDTPHSSLHSASRSNSKAWVLPLQRLQCFML